MRVEARADYDAELQYLLQYARDDWVGFSVISGTVASLLGRGASRQELMNMTLRIIGDLYDRGVRAGELTASDAHPFSPWPVAKEGALDRIQSEMRKLSTMPDSGDICWFTIP
ncbi:hypothetical protein ACFZCY_04770 [Streptomyces sp. NPDC007983]|uniref:hypothetical protein n=1 Tax=Streptomyces sp. NPDC007983 TaxID=3364800 RepID=UPI0036E9F6C9